MNKVFYYPNYNNEMYNFITISSSNDAEYKWSGSNSQFTTPLDFTTKKELIKFYNNNGVSLILDYE